MWLTISENSSCEIFSSMRVLRRSFLPSLRASCNNVLPSRCSLSTVAQQIREERRLARLRHRLLFAMVFPLKLLPQFALSAGMRRHYLTIRLCQRF